MYQFITNNHDSFHLWWKENLVKHQHSQNIMTIVVCKDFLCILCTYRQFQSLKSSHIFAGIDFTLLKERPRPNSKVLQYQICTSKKRSKRQLTSHKNFNTFLQLFLQLSLNLFWNRSLWPCYWSCYCVL